MIYLIALFASLLLLPISADAVNPGCGTTITGVVTLTGPLLCTSRGYTMASGAKLDCANFSITGLNLAGSAGIRIDNKIGVTVKRCVIQGFEKGIYATGMSHSVLKNNTLQSNTRYGAQVSGGEGNTLSLNHYRNNGSEGMHFSDLILLGTPNRSLFDTATGNVAEGFALLNVQNLQLTDCTTTANGGPGLYIKNSRVSVARCALTQDSLQVVDDAGVGLTSLESTETCPECGAGDECCGTCGAEFPPAAAAARIALVDGETRTPLSAEALIVALFACGLLIAKNPAGHLVGITVDHEKVVTLARALQDQLDRGETLTLQQQRIARPGLA